MEQNSGRIDPTPRPARSPPASFSRAPVVPAPGRTGKLGLIRLWRPVPDSEPPRCPRAVQPTLGAGHGPAGPNGPRPHPAASPGPESAGRLSPKTPEQPKCRNRGRIHRASFIANHKPPNKTETLPPQPNIPTDRVPLSSEAGIVDGLTESP